MTHAQSKPAALALLALAAALLALAVPRAHAQPEPLQMPWEPDPSHVLATMDGEPVTELDLFLFLDMVGGDPLAIEGWVESARGGSLAAQSILAETIRDFATQRLAARSAPGSPNPTGFDRMTRVFSHAGARLAFADFVRANEVVVDPIDVAYYYRQNQGQFSSPERAIITRARIPVEGSSAAARERALQAREQALRDGGLLTLLEREPGLRMTEPGREAIEVTTVSDTVHPYVRAEAFRLNIGAISEPVDVGSAMILVQVLDRVPAQVRPFEEVRGEIRELLAREFTEDQVTYQLKKKGKFLFPEARADFYPYMEDEFELVRVGDWVLTKGDFRYIYPQYPDAPHEVDPQMAADLNPNREGEIMAQALQAEGRAGDARFQQARKLAREAAAAREALRALRSAQLVTDDEIDFFLAGERDSIAPPTSTVLWRVTLEARARELTPERGAQAREQLLNQLKAAIPIAERQLAERAALSGPSGLADPTRVLERLVGTSDTRRLSVQAMGLYEEDIARREFSLRLAELPVGTFSTPRPSGAARVEAFYASQVVEAAAPTEEDLRVLAREHLVNRRAQQPLREELRRLEASGRLRWSLPGSEPGQAPPPSA